MNTMHLTADEVRATEAAAYGEAREVFKKGLVAIMAHYGIGYQAAVAKLRQLNLSYDEMRRLAAKSGKAPKVRLAQPESDKDEDDKDDETNPDEQLAKLGEAVRRVNPTFSEAQATVWAAENIEEGRELMRLSKRRSIGRYGAQATGHFDKAESPVSQALPAGVAKLSDADLTSLYREGCFDKLGGGDRGRGTTTDVSHTPPPPKPKVVRDPRDREAFDAGNARIADGRRTPDQGTFADRVKHLQNSGLNFDQASTQAMRERGNPDAISP